MSTPDNPHLAPPGAGLPAIEFLIGRALFALRRWTGDRKAFNAKFKHGRAVIRALVDSCPESRRSERVLIKRLPGLEDSSRFWSVWMTLDHLRITNDAFARIITDLTHGRMPEGKASTAAVKPSPEVTSSIDAEYERSCDALLSAVAAASELKTPLRFAHPWFGPLDAYSWHAISGAHMGIHRAQIKSIVAALK